MQQAGRQAGRRIESLCKCVHWQKQRERYVFWPTGNDPSAPSLLGIRRIVRKLPCDYIPVSINSRGATIKMRRGMIAKVVFLFHFRELKNWKSLANFPIVYCASVLFFRVSFQTFPIWMNYLSNHLLAFQVIQFDSKFLTNCVCLFCCRWVWENNLLWEGRFFHGIEKWRKQSLILSRRFLQCPTLVCIYKS